MSLSEITRLLARKWPLLVLVPLVLAASTYFFARHLPVVYSSDTTIYTGIASGYSLTGDAAADYNRTNNAFDNLTNLVTARSTKQEVIYRLLAEDLWQTRLHPEYLSLERYEDLREKLPPALRGQLTGASQEATLENVRRFADASGSNAIQKLLSSKNLTYSLRALNKLTATHLGASDLIKVEFDSYDPELCRRTLELVTEVFLGQSKSLRESQTASVIAYYEAELERAKVRLDKAEKDNLAFNRSNNIINYDAQSQNVATGKESLAGQLTETTQQYAGALAALKAVDRKLQGRQAALLSSQDVVEQRKRLSRLNAQLADQQLFGQQSPGGAAKARQLESEAAEVAAAIQSNVNSYYAQSVSTSGIPSKELLDEWVQNMVLVEANKAKLDVMNRRKKEFEREYERMAPLGATLKRIAREIDLAEKAYLTVLARLNESKASQQNTQLTANLKIVDPPNLPGQPKSNPQLILVILSALGGLVVVAGTVVGLGLLDNSLQNPANATRQTGLPVAGVLPDERAAAAPELQQRSLEQLLHYILLKSASATPAQPFAVGIGSVHAPDGKAALWQALVSHAQAKGIPLLALHPDASGTAAPSGAHARTYPAETAAVQGWSLEQLLGTAGAGPGAVGKAAAGTAPNARLLLLELPALRGEAAPPAGVLRQLDLVFLAVPASTTWRSSDRQAVELLRAATPAPVELVLGGVAPELAHDALS
ncbi:hypothetical protein GCM10023185_00240 [Hymenobacter saemangeumensis]|uniref:Polysaccharide chain length determinant N-terminal domain-containing protein n=1 Tax=Hymenobacter saemangeumensis TaxID=1084522 RepID=A0ABP8HWL8_9BACT